MHKDLGTNEKFNSRINYLNFGKAIPKSSTGKNCDY